MILYHLGSFCSLFWPSSSAQTFESVIADSSSMGRTFQEAALVVSHGVLIAPPKSEQRFHYVIAEPTSGADCLPSVSVSWNIHHPVEALEGLHTPPGKVLKPEMWSKKEHHFLKNSR